MRKFWRRILAVLSNCKGEFEVPLDVMESLARSFLPKILEFYENPENVKAYEEWLKTENLAEAKS